MEISGVEPSGHMLLLKTSCRVVDQAASDVVFVGSVRSGLITLRVAPEFLDQIKDLHLYHM